MSDFVVKQGIQLGGSVKGNTGTVTGNATLDLSTGDAFEVVPTADVTFAFSNPPAAGNAQAFSVALNGANVSTSYDLANAAYDSVSFSVAAQETLPRAVVFNSDGTKMFVAGGTNQTIYQYSLSTAFDVSTASYSSKSFSLSASITSAYDFYISPNGTKLFVLDNAFVRVRQFSLSTAFEIDTASFDNVTYTADSQLTGPLSLTFSPNGFNMYIGGGNTDTVFQYSLSTSFNLSTASYSGNSLNVSAQDSIPYGLSFNENGTKLFVLGTGSDTVYQYGLSVGFDLSTASYDSVNFSVTTQESTPLALAFNSSGTKMYIAGNTNDTVYQYSTASTPAPATITYPASVAWSGGTAPASPADGETDLLTFYTEDGGNTYYGFKVGDALA